MSPLEIVGIAIIGILGSMAIVLQSLSRELRHSITLVVVAKIRGRR